MIKKFVFTGVAMLLLAGCATSRGFNRGELRQSLNQQVVVDDAEIAKALKLKPQLPKPFKIALYLKEPATGNYHNAGWRWNEADKKNLLSLGEELKKSGEVSDYFLINADLANSDDLKSIRFAAAQHGADAVLVISGTNDIDAYNNKWGWTYAALVTALFVPASETDVLFMTHATMWDVRNQFLYMTAEAESMKKKTSPAAWTDSKPLIEEAKAESVLKLRGEIQKMASSLVTGKTKIK